MKLIILKNNLLEGLTTLEKAVGNNTNLPILRNFLIQTEGNKITLISTDLEIAVKYFLSGKIIENGKLTVPFFIVNTIAKNLTSERVDLETKEKKLLIKTDNYEATIQGRDPEEFPIIPKISNQDKFFKFKLATFKENLAKVLAASQYSNIRQEINGVFFKYEEKTLKLAATDSFRLAEKTYNQDQLESNFEKISFILPLKTAYEILRIPDGQEIIVFIDANQVLFKTENQEIISRLIDGHFPDYQSVIPKEFKTELRINREELIKAIKLTSVFSGGTNDISLKISDNKKFLEIYSNSDQLGENRYLIPVKLKGEPFSLVLNWRYFIDGLKIYQTEEIDLGINEADRPLLIKSSNDSSLFYILMPLKS